MQIYHHDKVPATMARPLSPNSRKVLRLLGGTGRSVEELAAATGIARTKLSKILWHLKALGWVTAEEELRKLAVYKRLRVLPATQHAAQPSAKTAPHLIALQAAFGIRMPARRKRGRTVRRD